MQNPYDLEGQAESEKQKQYEALTEWLFISMDVEGKVIIGHVYQQYMFKRVKKYVIIEPVPATPKFQTLSCRFRSLLHPSEYKINDLVTLVAVASAEKVLVLAITPDSSQLIKEIRRPQYKLASSAELRDLEGCHPALEWGYGHSPALKDKCYATLAVGWGPLVQLFVLNNLVDERQIFIEDGYVVMSNVDGSLAHSEHSESGGHGESNPYE